MSLANMHAQDSRFTKAQYAKVNTYIYIYMAGIKLKLYIRPNIGICVCYNTS